MKAKHINVTNVNEQDMNESLNKCKIELDIEFQISKNNELYKLFWFYVKLCLYQNLCSMIVNIQMRYIELGSRYYVHVKCSVLFQ